LNAWGPEAYVDGKSAAWDAIENQRSAEEVIEPKSRVGRAGWRNAIRQQRVLNGDTPLLTEWAKAFDRDPDQTDPENPGH
jgi:hypothetical protein